MGLKKKESSKTIETLEFPYVEKKKTEKENSIDKKPCVKKTVCRDFNIFLSMGRLYNKKSNAMLQRNGSSSGRHI